MSRFGDLTRSALIAAGFALVSASAHAVPLTYTSGTTTGITGSSGGTVSASFFLQGTTLNITLTDTATTSTESGVLTGLLFNTNITGTGTVVSSPVASSTISGTGTSNAFSSAQSVLTNDWLFKASPTLNSASYGVSSIASAPFTGTAFNGSAGSDFGIVGSGGCTIVACSSFTNPGAPSTYAVGSVTFQIANFIGATITGVTFLFGTAGTAVATNSLTVTSTGTIPVPEPSALVLFATGLLGLGFVQHRRMRAVRRG